MTIQEFAKRHRFKTRTDPDDGTTIIPGRNGRSHVYEYDTDKLAFMLMPSSRSKQWEYLKRHPVGRGLKVVQNGDWEGCALFCAENPEHVNLVAKVCRLRAKRRISPEQRDRMIAQLRRNQPQRPEQTA
jgi:hypothetical protein